MLALLLRKLFLPILIIPLFLLTAVPVSAHDLSMGGSEWSFGKNNIKAIIELNSPLLEQIKGIKEGHYNLDSCSDKQLQQIAVDIIQPYINKKLSISVNNNIYPIRVTTIVRDEDYFYHILLSANNISFKNPVNVVKINYELLFEETNNVHINIASIHLPDAETDVVETVFASTTPSWEGSIKGAVNEPAAVDKTASPVASGNSNNIKDLNKIADSTQKNTTVTPATDKRANTSMTNNSVINSPTSQNSVAVIPEGAQSKQTSDNNTTISSGNTVEKSSSESKENSSISINPVKRSFWANISEFLSMGIKHILTGYDHILFLLALIVIGLSIKEVLRIITAFTIAHSITLLLAALQIIRLNSRFVESVIAFSICYVALENLFRKKATYRWLVTFAFGLIHGFGFASILQELTMKKSNLIPSVLSFNLGVEIGQLIIFLVMLPILYLLKNKFEFRKITVVTSAAIFIMGFTWLVERVFNLKLLWF